MRVTIVAEVCKVYSFPDFAESNVILASTFSIGLMNINLLMFFFRIKYCIKISFDVKPSSDNKIVGFQVIV